jgi:hypothetical protein
MFWNIKLEVNNFSILERHEWLTASWNKVETQTSLENVIKKRIEMAYIRDQRNELGIGLKRAPSRKFQSWNNRWRLLVLTQQASFYNRTAALNTFCSSKTERRCRHVDLPVGMAAWVPVWRSLERVFFWHDSEEIYLVHMLWISNTQ